MSPKTAKGKAIVRLNGVQHGMRSILPVIKTEDAGEWEQHRAGIIASLDPIGALEMALVERAALLLWRLARVARWETSAIRQSQGKAPDDYSEARALLNAYTRSGVEARARAAGIELPPPLPTHPNDLKNDAAWLSAHARVLAAFPSMPDDTELGDDGASILHSVARVAAVKPVKTSEAATAGDVRLAIATIAARAKQDPAELLARAAEDAEREAHAARYMLKKAQAGVAAMEAERELPDGEALDKLMRYEAHLSRELRHALHELEAAQSRRRGEAAPLARIDVSGLAEKCEVPSKPVRHS